MESRRTQDKLPSYEAALGTLIKAAPHMPDAEIGLDHAIGHVLSKAVLADRDQPPFNRAAMDGFALIAAHYQVNQWLPIVGEIFAGQLPDPNVDLATGVSRIATGAAVPEPYDTVIQVELSEVSEDGSHVRFSKDPVSAGDHIHKRASDATAGTELLSPGIKLSPHHLAIAATAGAVQLSIKEPPRISLMTTGDEVLPPETTASQIQTHQIRNSNAAMLKQLASLVGGNLAEHIHIKDEENALIQTAERLATQSDIILTTGGVSAGTRDLLPNIWQGLGYIPIVHGVMIQPGKPIFIAQPADGDGPMIIGLPGNPVSVLVTFHLFVWPLINHMQSIEAHHHDHALPWRRVWNAEALKPNPKRELFRMARFIGDTHDQIERISWQGSGDIAHTAEAAGLIRLPMQNDLIPPGSPIAFLPLLGNAV
ncbi:molybdopterin molybdotransferase MoeA [Poriferisphaera sp. WC338]|uniref:molybdopterin molybdotransferase MoeA n=1 Tax=Poriferisphaera sp. WC338 TaxID=3425129 RepID=UPI003D814F52